MTREEFKEEFKEEFIKNGYIYGSENSFYKYDDNMVYCLHNNKPPVIEIKLWDIPNIENDNISISVCGQIKDGYWINIDFYSVTFNEALNNLKDIEQKLITAWNNIN